ncbi:MAG: sigma-70 family RNA polymerase sigma factor, partial [bacterium]|nr:sigma-70 family RNA polymerase sigma factor [bacterium]
WHEFIARYSPALRAFAARRFPTLDADDLLQETFLVLVRRLPDYVYAPDAKGAFHCYLVGILRCIALKTLARRMREQARLEDAGEDILHPSPDDADDASWRQAAYEIALRQFLADPRVFGQTKEVFLRVAVKGEPPICVARDYGLACNAVNQIKARTLTRLRTLVQTLARRDDLPSIGDCAP